MSLQHKNNEPRIIQKDYPSRLISRRAFCAISLFCLAGRSPPKQSTGTQTIGRPALIGVISTGHIDPDVLESMESDLRKQLIGLSAGFVMLRREANFSEDHLHRLTQEVLSMHPDVIICMDITAAVFVASRRTGNVPPLVFLGHDDPLAYHLIQSYSRPRNNLTGVTTFRCVDGKMVEILAEAFPDRKRVGYFLDFTVDNASCGRMAEEAASPLGISLVKIDVSTPDFIRTASDTLRRLRLDAAIAPASTWVWQNRGAVVPILNALHLPTIYESELFLKEGGLLCYGPLRTDSITQLVTDVRKILLGEAAGELPIEQPMLFELVVNLRAPHAEQYGISASVLRRADRILQ